MTVHVKLYSRGQTIDVSRHPLGPRSHPRDHERPAVIGITPEFTAEGQCVAWNTKHTAPGVRCVKDYVTNLRPNANCRCPRKENRQAIRTQRWPEGNWVIAIDCPEHGAS